MAKRRRSSLPPFSFVFFVLLSWTERCGAEPKLGHPPPSPAGGLCDQLIRPHGYPCTEHVVQTDDGFLLAVQRIHFGNNDQKLGASRPVFLQHGLIQGGDTWFLNPDEQSLGFILADHGFDVWVGNVRGTRWSYGHIILSEDDPAFWEWSWQEMMEYDLKEMIKLVYLVTNSKVRFVGHSQGTIMGLAAMTEPEIVDMVDSVALLGPISFLNHITSHLVLRAVGIHLDQVLLTMGIHELSFRGDIGMRLMDWVCIDLKDCGNILAAIAGKYCCFNESRIEYYLQYEPHSSSTRNLCHFFQMIRKGTFGKYDYGRRGNMKQYGQSQPPAYDLRAIPESLPIWLAYGGNDALADVADVRRLMRSLRRKPDSLYLPSYGHIDFLYSVNVRADVYDDMIRFLSPPRLSAST